MRALRSSRTSPSLTHRRRPSLCPRSTKATRLHSASQLPHAPIFCRSAAGRVPDPQPSRCAQVRRAEGGHPSSVLGLCGCHADGWMPSVAGAERGGRGRQVRHPAAEVRRWRASAAAEMQPRYSGPVVVLRQEDAATQPQGSHLGAFTHIFCPLCSTHCADVPRFRSSPFRRPKPAGSHQLASHPKRAAPLW